MKIVIVEVELNEYKTTSYVTLNSENEIVWEDGLKEYQIDSYIIETIEDQEVFGWIEGTNRFGKRVKRTYMLV